MAYMESLGQIRTILAVSAPLQSSQTFGETQKAQRPRCEFGSGSQPGDTGLVIKNEQNGLQPSGFKTLGLTPHGGRGSFAGLATWESVQRACFSCRHLCP